MRECDRAGVEALYDARLRASCPTAAVRPETAGDSAFLTDLFVACSPLTGLLPAPMVEQQARFQQEGHQRTHPAATRRIAAFAGEPAARIVIDWSDDRYSHCVDIAAHPRFRATMVGPAMLRAWIAVADELGRVCRLEVAADNRVRHLYHRLGFVPTDDCDEQGLTLFLERLPQRRS